MNVLKRISWLCQVLVCLMAFAGCSDDDAVNSSGGTGYLKINLSPQGITRAAELTELSAARKMEVSLLRNGLPVTQTLNLSAVSGASDLGMQSEKLELTCGIYRLMSYTLFSDVKPGSEEPERLLTVFPDEEINIEVTRGHISEVDLQVRAAVRGQVSFELLKDLSNFQEWSNAAAATRATPSRDGSKFNYDDIREVDLYYRRRGTSEYATPHTFKVYFKRGEPFLFTDTARWQTGEYELTRYMLYTKNRSELLLAADLTDAYVTVNTYSCTRSSFGVKYPANMASIQDYLALYRIWVQMDGSNWSYGGQNYPNGANWRFRDRPVSEWGNQPGVLCDGNGRVKGLDLGAFNPVGAIPEELGKLTELETLWLGTHNDRVTLEDGNGVQYQLNTYQLYRSGINLAANRMEIGKERTRVLYTRGTSRLYGTETPFKFAERATYDVLAGEMSNRIESIPASIRNLKRLTFLFVANGRIGDREEDVPAELAELPMLTDVEFYNCPFRSFPRALTLMSQVVALNFSANPTLPSAELAEGINRFVLSNKASLQILYLTDCGLETFPTDLRYASRLGLLDLAYNRLRELPGLNRMISPVQAIFDNNKIETIADDFCNTDDIETFSVSNNLVREFPNLFGNGLGASTKYKAASVDFSQNRITHFKEGFKGIHVEQLNLSHNLFGNRPGGIVRGRRTFPSELSAMNSKVDFLQIANCEIDSLPASAFKNLKSLQALDASGNRLRYIPWEFNVENLPYVTGLDLSRNAFTYFPVEVLYVQGLMKLYLGSQFDEVNGKLVRCMKKWPTSVYKHMGLRFLDISGNDVQKITQLEFPSQLAFFNVSDNPNIEITIPPYICSLIGNRMFTLVYDRNQYILGCPHLDLDIND